MARHFQFYIGVPVTQYKTKNYRAILEYRTIIRQIQQLQLVQSIYAEQYTTMLCIFRHYLHSGWPFRKTWSFSDQRESMSANEYDSLDSNFLRYVVRHLQIGHRNKKPITALDFNSCGSRWRCLFWGLPRLTSNMFASCPNQG